MSTAFSKVEYMFELQDTFNKRLNNNWKTAGYNFNTAIIVECGELIDSLNWKWWKSQNDNIANAKVECVDIWHFIMSLVMANENTVSAECKRNILINTFINTYNDSQNHSLSIVMIKNAPEAYRNNIISIVKNIIRLCCEIKIISLNELMYHFSMLTSFLFSDLNEFFEAYLIKNTLNIFRNKNGYKNGTYVKLWKYNDSEQEDNEVAIDLMRRYQITEMSILLEKLNDTYQYNL